MNTKYISSSELKTSEFSLVLDRNLLTSISLMVKIYSNKYCGEKKSTNHTECFKIPDSHTEHYRNWFFARTASGRNQLKESHIRAETDKSFRDAVQKCF